MQGYDATLKAVLQKLLHGGRFATGIGVEVETWLPTELPSVRNRRVDLLGRTVPGQLVHIEVQSTNDSLLALRMAEYALDILRLHGSLPSQLVLYFGLAPMKMEPRLAGPGLAYECRVVDIRELDGEALLESENTDENILAILARVKDQRRAIREVLNRIAACPARERSLALTALHLLAGLRNCGTIVEEETIRMPILEDIMNHDSLGPRLRKSMAEGLERGLERGRVEGERLLLQRMVVQRFQAMPGWAEERIASMSEAEIEQASTRLFNATSIAELLG